MIEGLRRLEYRGYDSAGIALVDGRVDRLGQAGRQAGQPREGDRRDARCRSRRPASGTPAGPPTAPRTTPTPTRTSARTAGSRWCTTGSSRTSPALRAELEAAGVELRSRDRHRDRRPPARARASSAGGDLTTAMQQRLPPARGRVHAGRGRRAGPVPGGGRAPQLAARGRARRGRELPRLRRRRVHRAHPRGARARPGPGRHDHPRGRRRSPTSTATRPRAGATTSTGTSRPPRRTATTGSCARRSSSSRGPSRDALLGRHTTRTAGSSSTRCGSPRRSCATIDKIIIIGCGTANYAGMVAKYAIEHWTRIPCEVELAHEFRYRDPILTRNTLVVAISQSGETADTLMAIRHAREQKAQGAGDLQHQRLDDPARVRRGDLHPRRPGDRGRLDQGLHRPSWSPATCSGSTSRRCAARKFGDEIAAVV